MQHTHWSLHTYLSILLLKKKKKKLISVFPVPKQGSVLMHEWHTKNSADPGGKADALIANYLLRPLWELGKDLQTSFPINQIYYCHFHEECHETVKHGDPTRNQCMFLVLPKESISSHSSLSPVASPSHWLPYFLKHHLTVMIT